MGFDRLCRVAPVGVGRIDGGVIERRQAALQLGAVDGVALRCSRPIRIGVGRRHLPDAGERKPEGVARIVTEAGAEGVLSRARAADESVQVGAVAATPHEVEVGAALLVAVDVGVVELLGDQRVLVERRRDRLDRDRRLAAIAGHPESSPQDWP